MSEWFKFRISPAVFDDINALAESNGGNNTQAVREAVCQWRLAVEEAAHANAADLSEADWERLAHTNDPDPLGDLDIEPGRHGRDWSRWLAAELVGVWDGKSTVLPGAKAEAKASRELAKRVAGWGRVRGYALMAALRYFWRRPESGIAALADPAVWMTPTAKKV